MRATAEGRKALQAHERASHRLLRLGLQGLARALLSAGGEGPRSAVLVRRPVRHRRDQRQRFITHNKKLKDCEDPVALVFGRMAALGPAYGPALIQLPPQLRRNDDRLAAFLALLPRSGRHAVEFRHESWYAPGVFQILADFDAALCISDHHSAPAPWEVTASWVYLRGHGPGGRYVGRYPPVDLQRWAEAIGAWRRQGRDVYAYFDNDVKSAAPFDALALKALVEPRLQRVRLRNLDRRKRSWR